MCVCVCVLQAICYFFYKNIVNVFTVVWYAMVTGFSGTLQYDDMVLCMYNLFFTSLPVIFFALLEQDVDGFAFNVERRSPLSMAIERLPELAQIVQVAEVQPTGIHRGAEHTIQGC